MNLSRSRLPKLAPDTILRERLLLWLADRADVPVRLVAAPAGSGKTTVLVSYASASAHLTAYVALEPDTSAAELCAAVAARLGLEGVTDEESLIRELATLARCEVLLDDVHAVSGEVLAAVRRLIYDAPENVTFVYATRTREVLDVTRLLSLGLAAVLDADQLAFTAEEAARFATAARISASERDVTRLVHESEGWAFALCSTMRYAAASGASAEGCFDWWRRRESRLIASFLDQAFEREDRGLTDGARRFFDGGIIEDALLDRLEARGLFVRWRDGAFAAYKALARHPHVVAARTTNVLTPFTVRLFGSLAVMYDQRPVAWVRRRDAQIFAFLALQPNGRASRQTLLRAFWVDADRQLAAQTLRSACSTMRRALAEVVGYAALPHYITFGEDIALNLDLFAIDARRVRAQLRNADTAWAAGEEDVARDHDRAALRLVDGRFLNGDVPAALEGVAAELDAHLARAHDRTERSGAELCPAV